MDDEEGPRQSLRVVFKELYEVVLAESGPRALEIAKSRRVDAAVLDIRMAGMSGTELLGHLKQLDPRIEVVMLTAYETLETARQALRHGACDYLTKPFEIPVIRDAVAFAVQRRALNDAMADGAKRVQELQEELRNLQLQGEMARSQNEIYASVMHDIGSPPHRRVRDAPDGQPGPRSHPWRGGPFGQGPACPREPAGRALHGDFAALS
ncbi:MAG: response regulator [Limisphaerales bacterium]